jgi:hypothetical protein
VDLVNKDVGRFRQSYVFLIMFLSFAVLAFGGYAYTNHVQRASDHQWCKLLVTITQPLQKTPPPTERQIRSYELLKQLARDKGCI